MPAPLTPEDVRLAVRAVVVHTAEEWPTGPLCRNDGASYPCRLHRWGRRVLETHGLNERQIEALIRHGNPFVHVPFPFTATGGAPAGYPAAPRRRARRGTRPRGSSTRGTAHRCRPAGDSPRHRAALAPGELSALPLRPPDPGRHDVGPTRGFPTRVGPTSAVRGSSWLGADPAVRRGPARRVRAVVAVVLPTRVDVHVVVVVGVARPVDPAEAVVAGAAGDLAQRATSARSRRPRCRRGAGCPTRRRPGCCRRGCGSRW